MNNLEAAMELLNAAAAKTRNGGVTKLDAIYGILQDAETPMTKREIINKATYDQISAIHGEDLDLAGNEEQREELIAISVKLNKTVGTAVSKSNNSAAIDYNAKYDNTVKAERIDGQVKYSLEPKSDTVVEDAPEVEETDETEEV